MAGEEGRQILLQYMNTHLTGVVEQAKSDKKIENIRKY